MTESRTVSARRWRSSRKPETRIARHMRPPRSGCALAAQSARRCIAARIPAFEALSADERDLDVGKLAAEIAEIEHFAGNPDAARGYIEIALDVAERHADASLLSHSLNTKSLLLPSTHPHSAPALLREALRVAEESDRLEATLRAMNNLIALMGEWDRPDEGWTLTERGLELARARGHRCFATWFGAGLVMHQLELGEWDDAFVVGEEALGEDVVTTPNGIAAALWLAKASWERGDEARSRPGSNASRRTSSSRRIRSGWHRAIRTGPGCAARASARGGSSTTPSALTGTWRTAPAVDAMLVRRRRGLFCSATGPPQPTWRPSTRTTGAIPRNHPGDGERIVAFKAIADGDEGAAADAFASALAAARVRTRPHDRGRARGLRHVARRVRSGIRGESRSSTRHVPCGSMGGTRWLELVRRDRRSRFRRHRERRTT